MPKKFEDADTSTTASAPKRQATGAQGNLMRDQSVVLNMAKLTLANSQNIRMLRSVLFTIKFPADSPWITSFKTATNLHNRSAETYREKGLTPDEIKTKIAIPCVRGFSAMVDTYIAQLPQEQRPAVEAAVDKWHWTDIHRHIPVAKIENMHDQKWKRLVLDARFYPMSAKTQEKVEEWTPTDLLVEMMKLWKMTGKITEMMGTAPPGELERKVQEWVTAQTS